MKRYLVIAVFTAAWVFGASYLSRIVVFGSLAPSTRSRIAFMVILFLGLTATVFAQSLIARRGIQRVPASRPILWPWGLGGAVLGAIAMLLTTRFHAGSGSKIPIVEAVFFGTFVGLWSGLVLGLGLNRRVER